MVSILLALSLAYAKKPVPPPEPPPMQDVAAQLVGQALLSNDAWEELIWLCDRIGARFNGSPALAAAVDWSAAEMERLGFANVRKEPVVLPLWTRGEAAAEIFSPVPRALHVLALGGSVGTPPEGIEAPVAVVDSFEQLEQLGDAVRGRIVLYDVPFTDYGTTVAYRYDGASKAAEHGAVAALVRSVTPTSLDTPHTGMMGYEDGIDRIPGLAITVEDAALLRRLSERGETPRLRLRSTSVPGGEAISANVMGDVLGRERPDEVVVLACHLDSWDVGQGAQDDGAGCAAAMGAAALIQELPVHPRRTVRVVFYVGEEFGIAGGKAYLEAHREELSRHVAAIESDSGAGQPLGFRVDVRSGPDHEDPTPEDDRVTEEVLRALEPTSSLLSALGAGDLMASYSGADIGPIVEAGVPGFGLEQDMSAYWPIHHTPADTVDKIHPDLFAKNVAVLAVMAYALAERPEPLKSAL